MLPTDQEALEFALMLHAGLPASSALLYFRDITDPADLAAALKKWQNSRAVKKAQLDLLGKSWTDMSVEERAAKALDQHYSQLAYLLATNHYAEAGTVEKAKMDSARQALEAKLAGQAGKTDALSRFLDDFRSGRLENKLSPQKWQH